MAIHAEIRLRNLSGGIEHILADFEALQVRSSQTGLGAIVFQVGGEEARLYALYAALVPDMLVEPLWRDDEAGILPHPELQGLLLDRELWRDAQGWHLRGVAAGLRHLLQRTMCYALAGTPEARKTGPAETVVKGFVDQEMGALAGTRQRADFGVAADTGGGATITVNGFNKDLLAICQEAHLLSGGDAVLTADAAAAVTFDWLPSGMGTDRRALVRFGLAFGNITAPRLIHRRSQQVNRVRVLGQGEGADRAWVLVEDAGLIAESKWGVIEAQRDARDVGQGEAAQLVGRGAETLARNTRVQRWEFEITQTAGARYGRDYFLGDLVRAELGHEWVDRRISGVTLEITPTRPPTFIVETEDL